jgi:prepilin-type N-terminal cleavage/methylation domain-containing protein
MWIVPLINRVTKKRGFTLIELTIVIVIIGILTVFATQGRTLIYESGIRAVADAFSNLENNIAMFYSSHGKPPGDLRDIYLEHPHDYKCKHQDGNPLPDNSSVYVGDNNGVVQWGPPSIAYVGGKYNVDYISATPSTLAKNNGSPNVAESFTVWCHLYLDGLLNKRYEPVNMSGNIIPGTNAPNNKLPMGNYFMYYDNFVYMNTDGVLLMDRPPFQTTFSELSNANPSQDVWGKDVKTKPPFAHVIMAARLKQHSSINKPSVGDSSAHSSMFISRYDGVYSGSQAMALVVKASSLAPGTTPKPNAGSILVGVPVGDDSDPSKLKSPGCVTGSGDNLLFDTSNK